MKKNFLQISIVLLLIIILCNKSKAQKIKTYNFSTFEQMLHQYNDTTYVVNFWAMWCKPCVEELPVFEQVRKDYTDHSVQVLLVSLDFGNEVEKKLSNFLKRKKINAKVLILDEPDANAWINKINPKWDGTIPATLIYRNKKKKFLSGKINHTQINKILNDFHKP